LARPIANARYECPHAKKTAALCTEAGLNTILDGRRHYASTATGIILFNSKPARRRPREEISAACCGRPSRLARDALGRLFTETMASRETVGPRPNRSSSGKLDRIPTVSAGDGLGVVFRDMTARSAARPARSPDQGARTPRQNTLATVQSITSQTFRHSGVDPARAARFRARLITLGVHGVLTRQSWAARTCTSSSRRRCARTMRRSVSASPSRGHQSRTEERGRALDGDSELCTNAIKWRTRHRAGHDIGWGATDGRFRWSGVSAAARRSRHRARRGFGFPA
jgi:hypothetical protein